MIFYIECMSHCFVLFCSQSKSVVSGRCPHHHLRTRPSSSNICAPSYLAFILRPGSASATPGDRQNAMRRSLSSVSVDGVTQKENGRVKRVKILTPEQREAIANLSCASQLTHAERKRQWGALNRKLEKKDTLPPGVLAKWERASTPQEKPDPQLVSSSCILLDTSLTVFFSILSGSNS